MTETSLQIWERLKCGKSLRGLDIGYTRGRVDLRNLRLPDSHTVLKTRTKIADVETLSEATTIRSADWNSIDFSSSQLSGIRLMSCVLDDCIFDSCRLDDFRVWGTTFTNISFRYSNLRGAVLGGVEDTKRNKYENVDFTKADLRMTSYESAEFVNCIFDNAKMDKVDFQSSSFRDCTFVGELRGVIFHKKGFKGEKFPENKMERVDLSRAKLRWTEFRGVDLTSAKLPADDEHIILKNYRKSLDNLAHGFEGKPDIGFKRLAAVIENRRRHAGPEQPVGIFNKTDILEMAGDEGLDSFLKIVKSTSMLDK